jgi:hypothetical protein
LEEKNYLKTDGNGEVIIDEGMATILWTCCEPQAYLIIENQSGQESLKKIYYVTLFLAVEVSIVPDPNKDIIIKTVQTADAIHNEVLGTVSNLTEDSDGKQSGKCITINETDFTQILSATSDSELEKICLTIKQEGYEEDNALSMAKTLSNPVSKILFLSLGNNENNQLDGNGFSVFKGNDITLIITPHSEENSFVISPYNEENISASVQSVLDRIYSTYLLKNDDMREFVNGVLSFCENDAI